MTPEEYLSEQKQQPTYTAKQMLKMILSETVDKDQLLQMFELLISEAARYDINEVRILREAIVTRSNQINIKTLADAKDGKFRPLQFLMEVLQIKK